jgi:hypothetical protein
MAKFESVPLSELKARLPAKLMRLVEESWCLRRGRRKGPPEGPQGCRSVAESPGPLPFRGEEGSLSFYLVRTPGRRAGAEVPKKKRGRPRKSTT